MIGSSGYILTDLRVISDVIFEEKRVVSEGAIAGITTLPRSTISLQIANVLLV